MTGIHYSDLVFVVGAPRSGTSWLQQLLGAHPQAVTPHETCVVEYLAPLVRRWEHERAEVRQAAQSIGVRGARRPHGLPVALTDEDFVAFCRVLVDKVRDSCRALKPGARVIVEKTPRHALFVDIIGQLLPDARIVHIIRDPRDVVASLLRGASGWARYWAPEAAEQATSMWLEHVTGARVASNTAYLEVRYEKLHTHTQETLARILDFCGLPATEEDRARIADALSLSSQRDEGTTSFAIGGELAKLMSGRSYREPEGFFGPARPGAWHESLRPHDRWLVGQLAGHEMAELGYASDDSWVDVDWPRSLTYRARLTLWHGIRAGGGGLLRRAHSIGQAEPRRRT